MPHHPGGLQDPGQLDLAPHATRRARAQRALQGGGGAGQVLLAQRGGPQLLGQGRVLLRSLFLQGLHPGPHLLELAAHRCQGPQHGAVPLGTFLGHLGARGQLLGPRLPLGGLGPQLRHLLVVRAGRGGAPGDRADVADDHPDRQTDQEQQDGKKDG